MTTSRKRKTSLSILCAMLAVFTVVCSFAPVAYAKDSAFDVSGKIYELDKESHYDYSSAASNVVQSGKNTFGEFAISGDAKVKGNQNGFPSYEVNSGNLSFSYSFDKKQLEQSEYEWCIYEDSGKEVAGVSLDEKIENGAIIIQASLDGKTWITEQVITNAFTSGSDLGKSLSSPF